MSTTIPEPGRHVHFIPASTGAGGYVFTIGQPHAAVISHVHSPSLVNLAVLDKNGLWVPKTSVPLQQVGHPQPDGYDFCRWMPYTLGKEAAEKMAAEKDAG